MVIERDFRRLPAASQAELRRVAVNLVLAGKSRIEVAAAVGVNRRFVGTWVRAFGQSGAATLAGGRRSRRPGAQKALTPRQETLIRDATRKVFVIVDNLRVHRAKVVSAWVADHADRIAVFYLPPYAPEFHPEEHVNNDLKQTLARRATPRDKATMKASLTSYMRGLQQRPDQGAQVLPNIPRPLCRMTMSVPPICLPG